jgi:probable HAF family extracellular repeat protein
MQYLDALYNDRSEARGVSANGAVVVGGPWRAFRWTPATGMQDLGHLGGSYSVAYGVSANGAVVVGGANNARYERRAFRWTASGGMQELGTLSGGRRGRGANGVSANGAVVVGGADNARYERRAFRWTASGGMQDLGTLGGSYSEAYGVSADGSVVVGKAQNAAGQWRAFRWTASVGDMENLYATYANLLTPGSVLEEARAISPNARYIVGWGINGATGRREAFLLDTGTGRPRCNGDVNGDGIVDDADLLEVLFNFGNRCP